MRGLRAVLVCLLTALALSVCMRRSAPVAVVQPQSDLDSLAYARRIILRRALSPRLAAPSARWCEPCRFPRVPTAPLRRSMRRDAGAYDAAYRLDAGDRLRIRDYGGRPHQHLCPSMPAAPSPCR